MYDISELNRQRKVSLNGAEGNRTLRPLPDIYGLTCLYLDITEYVSIESWRISCHGTLVQSGLNAASVKKYKID